MDEIIGNSLGGGNGADLIKDSNQQDFAKDVIEASQQRPVIVDFWAPWCGPCKQMMPALEQAVKEARGAVSLVKINVDENQMLASQLRVQSVPMVYAFFQGRPLDGFSGAQPPGQLKQFIDNIVKMAGAGGNDPLSEALEQAKAAAEAGELDHAEAIYGQILQHVPDSKEALAGLLDCKLEAGRHEEVTAMLDQIPEELKTGPEFSAIIAKLELAGQRLDSEEVQRLRQQLENDADDHQTRFDLAVALQAEGQREEAAEHLLQIVRKARDWNEEAARKQLLQFFEAWGVTDPMTIKMRSRLSSLLFS